MKNLANLSILILGLGHSGIAMARWCARSGAVVSVWDSRIVEGSELPDARRLLDELPQLKLLTGAADASLLDAVEMVLKSPGLSPQDEKIASLIDAAKAGGLPVRGELDLFVAALADLKDQRDYAPKLLAITGTNGKTTTTAMTALLIASTGKQVAVAGNIGPTMLQTLAEQLDLVAAAQAAAGPAAEHQPAIEDAADQSDEEAADELPKLPEVWVLELSSFQLDGVEGFQPDAAAVLNISEDHLDWHGSMGAYVAAKALIYGASAGDAVMIVNRDDARVEAMIPAAVPSKARFAKPVQRQVVRFGLDRPQHPGDFGMLAENGMVWLVRAQDADETMQRGRRGTAIAEELFIQRMMPVDALRVRGRHNAANALAALALAGAIGCPLAPMLHALRDYGGEPHRLQFIATLGGVDAFNDSKGTNVGATVAAIDGLGSDRAPAKLVLILGGDGKGQDFAPLLAPLRRHARAVATLGRDAEAIENTLLALSSADEPAQIMPMQRHPTLESATRWGFEQARPGDAVLLSPACASLDMFRNYGHRGEVFVQAVHAIAADLGEVVT